MSYPYQKILLIGATSGIGYALASKLASDGKHVIVVGRRKEKLDELQKKHGEDKISTIQFDITDLGGIKGFIESALKDHPEIDSVIMNSGIQRGLDFTKPESIDLGNIDAELTTNYISCIHILKYILPHLTKLSKTNPTAITFTTSGLALTPIPRCGNYCATKAALHHLILVLRHQLSQTSPNTKVIELLPPAVQTELHDSKHQPDIVNGGSIGMPLSEFMDQAWKGLCEGREQIPVGMSVGSWGWEEKRQEEWGERLRMIAGGGFK